MSAKQPTITCTICLIINFKAYFQSHHATYLQLKLLILNLSWESTASRILLHILKTNLCRQVFFNCKKLAEFWFRVFDESHRDLEIYALKVFVQNLTLCTYWTEKGFSALVVIRTRKRSCLLDKIPVLGLNIWSILKYVI